jgi:hypothetical protein
VAGGCTLLTVTTADVVGAATNTAILVTVNLSGAGAGAFYGAGDATCTGGTITTVNISAASSSATYRYRNNTPSNVTLAVADNAGNLTGDTHAFGVGPSKLEVTGAATFLSGVCEPFVVETQGPSSVAANALANITVNLSDGAASGQFYGVGDSSCGGGSVTSVVVGTGTSSSTFYYSNSTAENVTVSVSDAGAALTGDTVAVATLPDRLELTGDITIGASDCELYTITSKDAAGNAANVNANVTVNLNDGAGSGLFYLAGDATCVGATQTTTSVLSGSSSRTIRYKNTLAEAVTLNADDAGAVLSSGTLAVTVGAGAPHHLVLVAGNGQTAVVNNAVAVAPRVRVVDAFNNPVVGHTVNFAITDALAQSGALGAASAVTNGSGEASVSYTLGKTAGTNTMQASAAGLSGAPTTINFTETGSPDILDSIAYTVQPSANQTVGSAFQTQPVVRLYDQWSNERTGDNASVVTLTAFGGAGCSGGAAGALANNTDTVALGVANFAGLSYNAAEVISIRAATGGFTACSNTTTVYNTLNIDNPPGANLNAQTLHRFEVTGGVPPLTFSLSANNSGASIGAAYTGGLCPATKICADYTSGRNGGGSVDTVLVTDSASVAHTDTATVTVDGAVFTNIGGSPVYGSTGIDITRSFIIRNDGNAASGIPSVSFTPDNGAAWTVDNNFCTVSLAPAATCQIDITFEASSGIGSGPYTATLLVQGAGSGTITLSLTATKP